MDKEAEQAACNILRVARVVLLGSLPVLDPPSDRTHFLDFLSELVQLVLSFMYPGALTDRQIESVLHHAVDRNTLMQGDFHQTTCPLSGLSRRARDECLFEETSRFLEDTGCDRYDY